MVVVLRCNNPILGDAALDCLVIVHDFGDSHCSSFIDCGLVNHERHVLFGASYLRPSAIDFWELTVAVVPLLATFEGIGEFFGEFARHLQRSVACFLKERSTACET